MCRDQSINLKCLSWNTHGLLSIYEDNNFLNLVNNFDILFLSETWLKNTNETDNEVDGDVDIKIEGFEKLVILNRDFNIGTRNEGGIAIFCRDFFSRGY